MRVQAQAPSLADRSAVAAQLGRQARADFLIAARGACGLPVVIETPPRLPDGTPFPTQWYLTCRTLTAAVSTMEANGAMAQFEVRLAEDDGFARSYRRAHEEYLRTRQPAGEGADSVPELDGVSVGGMPTRVKCLHALLAQSLAAGSGVNPVGDAVLGRLRDSGVWPCSRPCVQAGTAPVAPTGGA